MTPREFAARLHGREYGRESTPQDMADAKAAGLVVVYGASDDLMEFYGCINDELGVIDGGTARICADGLLLDWESVERDDEAVAEDYFKRKAAGFKTIDALWAPAGLDVSWAYRTEIPHATFDVVEDGEVYCIGLVFAMADAFPGGAA